MAVTLSLSLARKSCKRPFFPTLGLAVLFCFSAAVSRAATPPIPAHDFIGSTDGTGPVAMLLSGDTIYGVTNSGGVNDEGTVYRVDTDGAGFKTLHTFGALDGNGDNPDGAQPTTLLIAGNVLYGTANVGGVNGSGTIFRINTDGTAFTVVHGFSALIGNKTNSDGANPTSLIISGTTLYGAAFYGGPNPNGWGTVFSVGTNGTGFQVLAYFGGGTNDPLGPNDLLLSGNTLYGTAWQGGANGDGLIFSLGTDGSNYQLLYSFAGGLDGSSPGNPQGPGTLALAGGILYGTTTYGGGGTGIGDGVVYSVHADGTSFQTLHAFNYNTDGSAPNSLLLNGSTLYGTADSGGPGNGAIFSLGVMGTGFQTIGAADTEQYGSPLAVLVSGTTLYSGIYGGGDSTLLRLGPAVGSAWSATGVSASADGNARMLWTRSDGAAGLWTVGGNDNETLVGPAYGPYGDSGGDWNALAAAAAPDGSARVLWDRIDGAAGLWSFGAQNQEMTVGTTFGPIEDSAGTWQAVGLGVAGDGTSRLLWTRSDGAAQIWSVDGSNVQMQSGPVYGPYAGWTATALAAAPDGTSRVLWTNVNGKAGVWTFDASGNEAVIGAAYGPYPGWTATGIGAANDGSSRVLWTNARGAAGLWSFDSADQATLVGTVYGPYVSAGSLWAATAVGVAPDGAARVLWNRDDRAAGVWTFGANDAYSVIGSVYGPY